MNDYISAFNAVNRALSKISVKYPKLKIEIFRDDANHNFTFKIFFERGDA